MKCKILSLSIAVLFCLATLPFLLSSTAFGVGCGTNPLGDTSGDTEFYVSKNQNQGVSGVSSTAQSAPAKAVVTLGAVAKADQNATIQSINPDKVSPQSPGTAIVWKVEASNSNNEKMLYNFRLMGPATNGQLTDETGWIAESSWTWNTTDADAGENQIEVQVMRAGSAGFEDSKVQSYVIAANSQNGDATAVDVAPLAGIVVASDTTSNTASTSASDTASSAVDAHPESKTSDPISDRPRVAPDERSRAPPTVSGPNMQMPDSTPKPPPQATTQAVVETATAMPVQVEPQEPEFMEVEGKWTVKLENGGATLNPLTIIQTGESVMGMGTLNEQNTKLQVSAKGSVSKNSMSLEAWTIVSEYGNKIDKRIELELVKVDRVISGSYEMYSGEELIGKGNATASRFAS
ncbi:MAG: hypothetical protein QG575_1522 [Euryarchaeota archaeon]|nr:hypothetical protein [Euryarchaeota archaeon]